MAEKNGTEESNSTPRPARRSGRNRKTTRLADSFKEYVENTPADEVNDLSTQLQNALGSIANSSGNAIDVTASCMARMENKQEASAPLSGKNLPSPSNKVPARRSQSMIPVHRPSGDEYYAPKSSSRRNLRAGSELSISMKLNAQRVLAELGEISDDDDDDDDLFRLGVLEGLREESVRALIREDSKYSSQEE
mmetsp:Transcript_42254/g.76241  ORF Transcript_42254/g.76241 Transcript_42254/m.76241 type:complete len:193 (-) Transcript_42254:87-665(-)